MVSSNPWGVVGDQWPALSGGACPAPRWDPVIAQANGATLVVLVMSALVIGWVLLRTHRAVARHRRGSTTHKTQPPQRVDPGHHLDSPDEVCRWEVQMHEIARDLSAQLDSKMGALQALIADADRAAARLEAATASTRSASGAVATPDPRPTSQAEALLASGGSHDAPREQPDADAPKQPPANRRQQEVYTLADYGLPPNEIATRIGRPVGEVELILSLRGKQ